MSDFPKDLPLTATQSIRIKGLATDPSGEFVELLMPRVEPAEPKEAYCDPRKHAHMYDMDFPHINRPSSPLPHELVTQLHLELGTPISGNKRHAVYNVEVLQPTPLDSYIPPLVIKIATTEKACQNLAHEAGLYGHIEALQGVLAPRCYGYFCAVREPGEWHVKLARTTDDSTSTPEPESDSDFEAPQEYVAKDPTIISRKANKIAVLLLEKMGDHLPPNQVVSEEHRKEMKEIFIELAEQRVYYDDWRPANLTRAPDSPPGLPSKPSSYSDRVYQLRLIDFEQAYMTNMSLKHLKQRLEPYYIDKLVADIEDGR